MYTNSQTNGKYFKIGPREEEPYKCNPTLCRLHIML